LIYGSVHVRCVYQSCGRVKQTLPKILLLAKRVRDSLRHDRMAGAELRKRKKIRARLPLNCPVSFSVRTILFLRAAWMKPRRESLAMLVHTSVYWADSQSSCDGSGILLSLHRIYALIVLIGSAPVNGVHNQSASLPMTASRYCMSARSLLLKNFNLNLRFCHSKKLPAHGMRCIRSSRSRHLISDEICIGQSSLEFRLTYRAEFC
jgi:hypothetical protein